MAINPLNFPTYNVNSAVDPSMWSSLGNLGAVYRDAQNRQKLSDLGKGLANSSIDYRTAAGQLADMGDVGSTLKFLALAQEQDKLRIGQQGSNAFHSAFGVPGSVVPSARPPTAAAIVRGTDDEDPATGNVPPRAPVASSATVVGDDEGVARGLYPPPPGAPQAVAPAPAPAPAPQAAAVPIVPTPPPNAVPRPGVIGEEGPTMAHMPYVMAALGNPYLPEGDKYMAQTMFKSILDNAKPNERIQFLTEMKDKSHFPGTLLDLELALRKSSAQNIDLSQKQESTAATEGAKVMTKRFADYSKAGEQSNQNLGLLDMMKELRTQFPTGGGAALQAWLADRGIKVGKNVGQTEAYNAIIEHMTPWQRPPGAGATSDAEEQMYRRALPKLINSPGGNDIIDATIRAQYDHNIEMGRISDLALVGPSQGGISHGEALKRMRELPSPFKAAVGYIKNGFKPIDPAEIKAELDKRKLTP